MRTLVVHWSSFGPYHLARLNAAANLLMPYGVRVAGMEMTSRKALFGWEEDPRPTTFDRYVALPGQTWESVSHRAMWRGAKSTLDKINPDAVAINGYSYYDSWSALTWCGRHRRPAILMSDSKRDDTVRLSWKEWLKSLLVRQYKAALCAGSPQSAYLQDLGMKPEKITFGVDVVDNDYFWQNAELARKNPNAYCSLPGLESNQPFFLASSRFVKRKNIDGLIRAYAEYRHICEKEPGRELWRLVILGDGVERHTLEDLVRAEGVEDVTFAGFHQNGELPIYYGRAKVFVHPALQDQWGLVVNEAMASGLPVLVSTGSGCAADLVEEGQNGFTFAPEDIEALTKLMVLMSSGQIDLDVLGRAAHDRIGQWGLQRFAQGLHQAWMAAIQQGS